jgi:hypothetical protein
MKNAKCHLHPFYPRKHCWHYCGLEFTGSAAADPFRPGEEAQVRVDMTMPKEDILTGSRNGDVWKKQHQEEPNI